MKWHNRMRWTGDHYNQLNSHTLSPKLPFHKDGRTSEYLMRWYSVKKYQKMSNVLRKTQTFRVYDPSSVGEKSLPGEHVSVQMTVRDKPLVLSPSSSFYYKETEKYHGTPLFGNSVKSSWEVWYVPTSVIHLHHLTSYILGWFSNSMGTSVDDCARKSNNWLDQWHSEKLGTGRRV